MLNTNGGVNLFSKINKIEDLHLSGASQVP
jgi:hypothetical protein